MDSNTTKALLEVLDDAQSTLFDAMNNLPASEANRQVAQAYNLIGHAIAIGQATASLKDTRSDAVSADQLASTLGKVWSGCQPGDKRWSAADDTALERALADLPEARDALLEMTVRAMTAEAKVREYRLGKKPN